MAMEGFAERIPAIIDQIGRTVTHRTFSKSGTYDPTLTPFDSSVTAAVFDYTAGEADGSIIQREDKLMLISAQTVITKGDRLIDGSKDYGIISLELIGPGDESFYYRAQCRL